MKKKLIALLLASLCTLSLLVGCTPKTDGNVKEPGNSEAAKDAIIIGIGADATSMDLLMCNDTNSMSILYNVYEPLVRSNQDGEIVPALAERWAASEDGTEYVFHVRTDARFHNGDMVTAEDIKYSLQRAKDSPISSGYFSYVNNIEVVDEKTVKVTLDYAYAGFVPLCATYGYVVKESYYSDGGENMSRNPIGSGPYKFISWAQGDKIELEAFPEYYAGEANIKKLTYKVLANTTTAAIAMEKGEIDMYIGVGEADIQTLKSKENIVVDQVPSVAFYMLGMNCESKIFSDVRVRQAVAKAIDRDALVYGVLDGNAQATKTFIYEGLPGYDAGFDPLPLDIEGAKQLLKDAGYENGLSAVIKVPENRSEHAQMIQADLDKIGIDLEIQVTEAGRFWDDLDNGDFDMMIMGWSYTIMNNDVGSYALYHSAEVAGGNYVRNNIPRVDELLLKGRETADEKERGEIYGEIEELVMTNATYVPLYWKYNTIAFDKNLEGVKSKADNIYLVYNFGWKK